MNFQKLSDRIDTLGAEIGSPYACCLVEKDRQVVFVHGAGCSDLAQTRPASPQDLYWIYSATKPIVMTAAMQLVEKGLLALDAPVGEYLPAWAHPTVRTPGGGARAAVQPLTIRRLMAMTGGLNYDLSAPAIRRAAEQYGAKATTRQVIDALAQAPLDFEPGSHFQYSLCHDVIGAVIEAVSGRTLGQYLQEHIFAPLGMTDTAFSLCESARPRLAAQYLYHPETKTFTDFGPRNSMWISDAYEAGGSGLLSSLADYRRFASALANDGVGETGARILTPASLDEMTRGQLAPQAAQDFLQMRPAAFTYGLGVCILQNGAPYGIPSGSFGWDGAAGFYAQMDRATRSVVLYGTQLLHFGPQYGVAHYAVRELAYEGMGLRTPRAGK